MKSFIASVMLLMVSCVLRAQPYVPVVYNFGPMFEVTDDSAGTGYVPTNITIDCLTANGYGQWTSSYKTQNAFDSGKAGIFLLANALRPPAVINASGIVSARPIDTGLSGYPVDGSNRSLMKCVSNTKGRVRYVWPSSDHSTFIVEGFDECAGDSLSGINLQFISYPYNPAYGTGNQHLAADVIKPPYPEYYPIPIVLGHHIVSAANELDPRDWFSVAMDTANLYIAWEEFDSTGSYNIWAISQSLATGATFPPVLIVHGGRRPTIAADLRRPTSAISGNYDIAYITGLLPSDHLTWCLCDTGVVSDTIPLAKTCQKALGVGDWNMKIISHAKMLDATWEQIASSDSTPRAIYAIVTDSVHGTNLVLYKIHHGVPDANAYYCDGPQLTNHAPQVNDGAFSVLDNPLRAFVNPYDGEADSNFDEYHCMYQLLRTYTGGAHQPLMLVHGAMVNGLLGTKACLNAWTPGDSLSTVSDTIERPNASHVFYPDPAANDDGGYADNYNGAVNQMGIHLHWRNGTQHYYLRDRRKFDENIEENTLATEDVYVDDGTSHGGNYTPTVQPGKTFTAWTQLDFGGSRGACTLYFPITGTNMALTSLVIGSDTGNPSKFALLSKAYAVGDTNSQQVRIEPNSSMEVYTIQGLFTDVTLNLLGTGASMTGGAYNYPTSISRPAYLNLHGSCGFTFDKINADSSIVNLNNDQTVTDGSSDTTGSQFHISDGFITNSIINNLGNVTDIDGNANWEHPTDTLSFFNTLFLNGFLDIGDIYNPILPCNIIGGKFKSTPAQGILGPNSFIVENVEFDDTIPHGIQKTLWLFNENGMTDVPYEHYNVSISGCDFVRTADSGIALAVYDFASDSDAVSDLQIDNNKFTYADGLTVPQAAIWLGSSEGLIYDNTITGAFHYGIYVTGANAMSPDLTKSIICSNFINGAAGDSSGIYTDHTQGYSESNEVTTHGDGHRSGPEDHGKIIYSNYSDNSGNGIFVTDSTGFPYLTGTHSDALHPDSIDIAAFDTIQDNAGSAQIDLTKGSHVALGNDVQTWTWTKWCQNNVLTHFSSVQIGGCMGPIIFSDVPLIIEDSGKTTSKLGNISHNYFGDTTSGTILPENQPTGTGCDDSLNRGTPSSWLTTDSTPIVADGFCYNADSNLVTWQARPSGPINCGEVLPYGAKSIHASTLSSLTDTSCRAKYAAGSSLILDGTDYAENAAGDSILEEFVETCYDTANSYLALQLMNGYEFGQTPNPQNFVNFINWLKTVLWLGPMYPGWYCTCAQDMYESYAAIDAGRNLNAALAVIRYLDSSGRCDWDADKSTYLTTRHQVWLDTVQSKHNGDTLDFPEDTTLPTIDELGLSILRGTSSVQQDTTAATGITNLTASENPFEKSTTISFETGEYSYLSFQVFDVLGRVVQGNYAGTVLQPGSYSFTVDGTDLPAGTYYARIATLSGETRMLKLVKE